MGDGEPRRSARFTLGPLPPSSPGPGLTRPWRSDKDRRDGTAHSRGGTPTPLAYLERVAIGLREDGLTVETHIRIGKPGPVVRAAIGETAADVAVLSPPGTPLESPWPVRCCNSCPVARVDARHRPADALSHSSTSPPGQPGTIASAPSFGYPAPVGMVKKGNPERIFWCASNSAIDREPLVCQTHGSMKELSSPSGWQPVETNNSPVRRHECGFVELGGRFYLLGGRSSISILSMFSFRFRGEKPVNVYDPVANTWTEASKPPMEVHHFQPIVYEGRIWIAGALTGAYPNETPVSNILIYDPHAEHWSIGPEIPTHRRRGSGGGVLYEGKIYMVGGIVDGHNGDFKNWLDEYDPNTNTWRVLPDAPRPRDHFQAATVGNKLYAAGGRTTSKSTGQPFELTVKEVDVYDFNAGRWTTLESPRMDLPTPRGGTLTVASKDHVIVIGGESAAQPAAHSEVETYNVETQMWTKLDSLVRGRHGTGALTYDGNIYVCAGSGRQGGGPELSSLEAFAWAGLV